MSYGVHATSYTAPNFVGDHHPVMRSVTLASTGAETTLEAGTVLGRVTADGKYKALTPAADDGTETARVILVEDVTVPASGDAKTTAYCHGVFLGGGLIWPEGVTAAQKAAAVDQLADVAIIVK